MYTDDELRADVEQHQWVVLEITPDKGPEYGYSVGLTRSFNHPELAVVGLDDDTMQDLVNEIGEAIANGAVFADGSTSGEFLEGYDVTFRALPATLRASHFAWADRLYGDADFSVLQVVYPDRKGRWPWDPASAADFRKGQPILG
jgi:hypothetical protein